MKPFIILSVLVYIGGMVDGIKLPGNWNRCKVSQSTDLKRNKCLEGAVSIALKDLTTSGSKEFDMMTMDPFRINRMVIGQEEDTGPVRLTVKFKNLDVIGFKNVQVKSVRGKLSSTKDWFITIEATTPKVIMLSDYNVNGNVLVFPIKGSGKCKLDYESVFTAITFYGEQHIKDDKEYLKIVNQTFSFNIEKMHFNFENLFDGNKLISDSMNNLINENWKILYEELKPSVEKGLLKHLTRYAKKILEKTEYKELFNVE